jgi:P4 family phage/plasmid primase-like protien
VIQILAARSKKPGEKPVFGFIPGVGHLWSPSLNQVLTGYQALLGKIPADEQWNLFYTVAHHRVSGTDRYPARTAGTFEYQTALAFDIDAADTARAMEYATLVAEVLRIKAEDTLVIASGNGVHVIVALKYPVSSATAFAENRDAYKEILHKVKAKMEAANLPGTPDPSIFDPARVLRLPGTVNRKPSKADTECRLIQATSTTHDLDLFELSGLKAIAAENVTPAELKRQFPTPDFAEMRKECRFMGWAETTPAEVHEPQMFDFLSLLAPQKDPAAKEVAKKSYDGAVNSQSLQRQDFDKKWEDAARYGGRKCATIAARWEGCSACPHHEKIVSPFQLKSKGHLSSVGNGYWVLGSKGQHLHPHYEDLMTVHQEASTLVVASAERVMRFQGERYAYIENLPIKGWVDKTVAPTEPLRERHRVEFLHRLKSAGALDAEQEENLFVKSIQGKLNCKNGVLDILTGELHPHAPQFGFKYVLDYDYQPDQASEFFIDWLATITENRTELMESLLDVMAYILWPTYEDALLVYFIGEGANGKSTLMHLIRNMIGRDNYSSASISQLVQNRFAPSSLDGKLANISEESSGLTLTSEGLDILKALSAGDEIQVERKNQGAFTMKNTAKLLFSANKPPVFKEQGVAVKRRLLVIPFDHVIREADPGVEARLLTEIPLIVSMLIRRIPEILAASGKNQFRVRRGGVTAEEARKKMLTSGDSVCLWAKERLESSVNLPESNHISVLDAFADYGKWCTESGFQKPVDRITFGKRLRSSVLTAAAESKTVRIGGKPTRVYPHTRFVDSGDADAL